MGEYADGRCGRGLGPELPRTLVRLRKDGQEGEGEADVGDGWVRLENAGDRGQHIRHEQRVRPEPVRDRAGVDEDVELEDGSEKDPKLLKDLHEKVPRQADIRREIGCADAVFGKREPCKPPPRAGLGASSESEAGQGPSTV